MGFISQVFNFLFGGPLALFRSRLSDVRYVDAFRTCHFCITARHNVYNILRPAKPARITVKSSSLQILSHKLNLNLTMRQRISRVGEPKVFSCNGHWTLTGNLVTSLSPSQTFMRMCFTCVENQIIHYETGSNWTRTTWMETNVC